MPWLKWGRSPLAATKVKSCTLRALDLGTGSELWCNDVARPEITEETMKDKFKAFNALVLLNLFATSLDRIARRREPKNWGRR